MDTEQVSDDYSSARQTSGCPSPTLWIGFRLKDGGDDSGIIVGDAKGSVTLMFKRELLNVYEAPTLPRSMIRIP